jgi:hypothetical protein
MPLPVAIDTPVEGHMRTLTTSSLSINVQTALQKAASASNIAPLSSNGISKGIGESNVGIALK